MTMMCCNRTDSDPTHLQAVIPGNYDVIAVDGQPQQLRKQTLLPPVFQMLLTKLPTIRQIRMLSHRKQDVLIH
ncbi:hypothetical protein J4Q44_G00237420 [Coregonus suidteri]|uniref:Uncharacterized protein n=1 Tax=Coregonus suidteri TaxID=861788 RepID=A0AAN8LB57_9TELE